jgi:hypothetical protein
LDDVVLFSDCKLQRFEVMVLVDVNVIAIDVPVEANEVKAFDSHVERFWLSSSDQSNDNEFYQRLLCSDNSRLTCNWCVEG